MLEIIFLAIVVIAAGFSAGHVLLHKRDPRAALVWVVICFALPIVGAMIYWLLGVNRIRTRARDWQDKIRENGMMMSNVCFWSSRQRQTAVFHDENYASLLALADTVTRRPLLPGNRVTALHNGEEAYPAMLRAISGAKKSVYLSSYLFSSDTSGRAFAAALKKSAKEGLDVRVLIDGLGERYSLPTARHLFRNSRVQYARFLPPSFLGRGLHFNLRNHRKLLIVDGEKGFTGGMNIGDRHLVGLPGNHTLDIHFDVQGPVVCQMLEAFMEDWHFITGDVFPNIDQIIPSFGGEAFCRGISAGPNEDFEKLRWIYLGAINCARQKIRLMMPYFVPDRTLMEALTAAALRGVEVTLALPSRSNLPYVDWASRAYFSELLENGIHLFLQPLPFSHGKLLLVDDHYALVGSANLDARSLRLNFEFNLEVFDPNLNSELAAHFDAVCSRSLPLSLEEISRQPLASRLRDGFAKLFSPYL